MKCELSAHLTSLPCSTLLHSISTPCFPPPLPAFLSGPGAFSAWLQWFAATAVGHSYQGRDERPPDNILLQLEHLASSSHWPAIFCKYRKRSSQHLAVKFEWIWVEGCPQGCGASQNGFGEQTKRRNLSLVPVTIVFPPLFGALELRFLLPLHHGNWLPESEASPLAVEKIEPKNSVSVTTVSHPLLIDVIMSKLFKTHDAWLSAASLWFEIFQAG